MDASFLCCISFDSSFDSDTVETHIVESRFFVSSLDRFLISGLVFSIPVCKDLNKVFTCSTCFACIYIVFSTRILDDSLEHFSRTSCIIILSYVVQLEKRRQPMKVATHKLLNQQYEIHYIKAIPISASLGFLFKGFKQ